MIVSSASIGADWFLNGISNLQRQEVKTQRELSSGFQIQDASDSPSQTPALIDLGSSLASLQSYQTNLGRVQAETGTADTALGTSITLLDNARTLAVQGASSTATAGTRQNLALQVQSIQQQFVSLANTTVEGRYIFGGDQDQSPPYRLNPASATGVDKLTPQTSTRTIEDVNGAPVYQSSTAATIFDHTDPTGAPAPDNAFAGLQQLQAALQANDGPGIAGALTSLEGVSSWLNLQQATYGTAERTLTQEQNNTASQITNVQVQIAGIRDTNVAQAATDLSQENASQSAAVESQAQIPTKSLFDYLA